jgi:hypothetical protein
MARKTASIEPSAIQKRILEIMKDRNMSHGDVVRMKVRSRNRVYEWLAGRAYMRDDGVAAIMEQMGLIIVPLIVLDSKLANLEDSGDKGGAKKSGRTRGRLRNQAYNARVKKQRKKKGRPRRKA